MQLQFFTFRDEQTMAAPSNEAIAQLTTCTQVFVSLAPRRFLFCLCDHKLDCGKAWQQQG